MARKRNRSRKRDHSTIATRPRVPSVSFPSLGHARHLLSLDDGRAYHPFSMFRTISTRKHYADVVPHDPNVNRSNGFSRRKFVSPFAQFQFRVPGRVTVCVRRSQRRQVLFAKRRTGKGARSPKRRNQYSDVRC